MNRVALSNNAKRAKLALAFQARRFDRSRKSKTFSDGDSDRRIGRIYVINLDRQPYRWHQVQKELERFYGVDEKPLTSITRRFSAVDGRYMPNQSDDSLLRMSYSLADQLHVQPHPLLKIDATTRAIQIDMSPQESAIALSHIAVWKLVAANHVSRTLVLEDDVFFRRGFARRLDTAWRDLFHESSKNCEPDILYLSYDETCPPGSRSPSGGSHLRQPIGGLWQASGYVLSRSGARKLLAALPVYGPVDLWMNLQFDKLNVFMTQRPIIEQRVDVPTTNSYSVLPVLSQVGAITLEKPLVPRIQALSGPVFGWGESGSGLTTVAKALSMLGYTCCSDLDRLPIEEDALLMGQEPKRMFNAYVNIGSLSRESIVELVNLYPDSRFIQTSRNESRPSAIPPSRFLHLPRDHQDPWEALSQFLTQEYPAFPYPYSVDLGQRTAVNSHPTTAHVAESLRFDRSPWILSSRGWDGIRIAPSEVEAVEKDTWHWTQQDEEAPWRRRDDTFPSNKALFRPGNTVVGLNGVLELEFRNEASTVRDYTSAAIASRSYFLYGRLEVDLKAAGIPGLITGVFLHRNGPRQEIDIELLGDDPTKMLVNVYYNPGGVGTKLEYGYRGTPMIINLGFDASKDFHRYEIDWQSDRISWRVDGQLVHERLLWNPTPIPDCPLEINVNLWNSRSKKLAGKLDERRIPASSYVRTVDVTMLPGSSTLRESV